MLIGIRIDGVFKDGFDVVLEDFHVTSDCSLDRTQRPAIDGTEGGLDVDAIGEAKVDPTIERHGQWAKVKGQEIAGGATKDNLFQDFASGEVASFGSGFGLPACTLAMLGLLISSVVVELDDQAVCIVSNSECDQSA